MDLLIVLQHVLKLRLRVFSIVFLCFIPCYVIAETVVYSEKLKAVELYDRGQFDRAIAGFKKIAASSLADRTICWLNIALVELEKGNHSQAVNALNNANKFAENKKLKGYLNIAGDIIHKKQHLIRPKQLAEIFQSTADPAECLFLWTALEHWAVKQRLRENNGCVQIFNLLKKSATAKTYRWAKILRIKFYIGFNSDENYNDVGLLVQSNDLLEKLGLKYCGLYMENVRIFFMSAEPRDIKPFTEQLNQYEADPQLMQDKGIKSALYNYKATYIYRGGNDAEAFLAMKTAYELDPKNPRVMFRFAFFAKNAGKYQLAANFYNKLHSYPKFINEAFLGTAQCAFEQGDMDIGRKLVTALLNNKEFNNSSINFFLRLFHTLRDHKSLDLIQQNNFTVLYHLSQKLPKNIALKSFYYVMGTELWYQKKYNEALMYYQKGILELLPYENSTDVFADLNFKGCLSLLDLSESLNAKGETFYQMAKTQKCKKEEIRYLKECLKNLDLSIEQMYVLKMQLPSEEQMYMFSGLKSKRYPNIIKVCLELYNLTGDKYYHYRAFNYAEQGRAAIMLSMLRSKQASRVGLIPAKYKMLEDSLNTAISLLSQNLKKGEADKYKVNTRIDVLANKRAALEELYKKQYPQYYRLKYSLGTVAPVAFQKSLGNDDCVIEYLLDRNFLIAFYLDNKNLKIITDTLRGVNLDRLVGSFYNRVNQFSSSNYKPDSIRKFVAEGRQLYNILLKPFESHLKGKRITIIADNSLRKLPFEVLINKAPATFNSYRDLPYLVKTNSVYYAPSATFVNELKQRQTATGRPHLLAVAPVYSSLKLNDTLSRMLLAVRSDTSVFGSLPNAKKEIEFAHSVAGGKLLKEKRATETRFKKLLGNYDIVHLATHGIMNSDSSFQSKLLFAESSPADDGFLHNYEIYNLKQSSQLVILSACNTGSGKNYGGEEVISTGRAFLSSGSRSVIMTLWPVNDHASFELIREFYQGLANDLPICDALRHSKLKYLHEADNLHSHPYFWTGYVVYGDAAIKLSLGNDNTFYLILLCSLIFVPLGARLLQWLRKTIISVGR